MTSWQGSGSPSRRDWPTWCEARDESNIRHLQKLRAARARRFSPFITAGDPSPRATVPAMNADGQERRRCDRAVVPFPTDGRLPGSALLERALRPGVDCATCWLWSPSFAAAMRTPVVLMGYANDRAHGPRSVRRAGARRWRGRRADRRLPPRGERRLAHRPAGLRHRSHLSALADLVGCAHRPRFARCQGLHLLRVAERGHGGRAHRHAGGRGDARAHPRAHRGSGGRGLRHPRRGDRAPRGAHRRRRGDRQPHRAGNGGCLHHPRSCREVLREFRDAMDQTQVCQYWFRKLLPPKIQREGAAEKAVPEGCGAVPVVRGGAHFTIRRTPSTSARNAASTTPLGRASAWTSSSLPKPCDLASALSAGPAKFDSLKYSGV